MTVDLKDIASISEYTGLFKVIKPARNGIIVERIDAEKKRSMKSTHNKKVTMLEELGVYTTEKEKTVPLSKIFENLYKKFSNDLGISSKDSPEKLYRFIQEVIPNYDKDNVYPSDIKKLINWYNILIKYRPELFKLEEKEKVSPVKEETNQPAKLVDPS